MGVFVAPRDGEAPSAIPLVLDPKRGVTYGPHEVPGDRDIDGTLWQRWAGTPTGALRPAEHHPARQRIAMERLLCAVGGGPPDRQPHRGMLWLLPAEPPLSLTRTRPRDVLTATPPTCMFCAHRALITCDALRRGHLALRVPEAEPVGVRGTVYSPTGPPVRQQFVAFTDPAIRWVVAEQLVLELRGAVPENLTVTRRSLPGRHPRPGSPHRANQAPASQLVPAYSSIADPRNVPL
ncbi:MULTISPECIES: hypothetical protein [Streptomyces]|uniref:hypothetical protein n=1 Tax=Streptomyces TaxID=1883 RepID=UPI00163C3843|nr:MULTISPECIES: hypothetical protein [Streptomyces]MBC2879310.1 hypothetical protein [Streptomyces sp. TYQ1024]UBI40090.1 hypothetical protein K7I03_28955 [Streptomyces mobaraensis]UKW32669.1 hypothetical protein MCU78_28885 [Streptomyces sp. TYQ1024]